MDGKSAFVGSGECDWRVGSGCCISSIRQKPEGQSTIKILVVLFLMGVMLFALSQIVMFVTRQNMEFYFLRLREPTEWEKVFWNIDREQQQHNPLAAAKTGYLFMMFLGMASLACFLLGLVLVTFFVNGL